MNILPSVFPSRAPEGTPAEALPISGELAGDHLLVPLLNPAESVIADQIRVAASIARSSGASLHVIDPVAVPDGISLEVRHRGTDVDDEELLEWALEQASTLAGNVEGGFFYTRRLVSGVLRAVETHDVDTLVLPGQSPNGPLGRDVTERVATHADCDVLIVNGQSGYDSVASILLPVAGGPHSGLAADVAGRIADACDAWIDVLHVVGEDAPDRERNAAQECVEAATRRIARPEQTSTWILEAADVEDALIEQSQYYGLTVLGAPTKGRLRRFVYGSTSRSVRADARSVVLSARNETTVAPATSE